jgi:hypothetical protein
MRHSGVGYKIGWLNSKLLVEVMKHYIWCSNSSKNNSLLPILDNYQSHISIEVMDVAKDKGVIMLTLPQTPPTHTHFKETSASGCGLFSALKRHYYSAMNSKILHTKAILSVIHHFQNSLGSTKGIHFQ